MGSSPLPHRSFLSPPLPSPGSAPALLLWILLLAVGLEGGIHLLPQQLHVSGVREPFGIWPEGGRRADARRRVGTTPSKDGWNRQGGTDPPPPHPLPATPPSARQKRPSPPPPPCPSPGLKRMMARRQPSSVLSIRMSRIFDTSSVSTLHKDPRGREGGQPV